MSTNDLDAAVDAIAASLTADVLRLERKGELADVPAAELAAVGAFLLAYRRDGAALSATAFRVAVEALGATDRIALAEEVGVAVHTVDRWALGTATPHPEIAARAERWCEARSAAGAEAEMAPATVERDDGPREHIPRSILDGAG